MTDRLDLSEVILARADRDGLPAEHPLREHAASFKEALTGYWATPQTVTLPKFLGTWARARAAWSQYSGEPLV